MAVSAYKFSNLERGFIGFVNSQESSGMACMLTFDSTPKIGKSAGQSRVPSGTVYAVTAGFNPGKTRML